MHIDRVIVDSTGFGAPPILAERMYGVTPHIAFKRDDGWVLAAPRQFETIAYLLYYTQWTHFAIVDGTTIEWRPISHYLPA